MTESTTCVACGTPLGTEPTRPVRTCFIERSTTPATDREHLGADSEYIHLRCRIPYGYKADRTSPAPTPG